MRTLKVALLWHFHQPSYWDPRISRYRYPWVFLHNARHYHAMGCLARRHPETAMAFNFTPVLLEQMEHYIEHGPRDDRILEAVLRPATDLSEEELQTILEHAFKLNLPTMVLPFPRYRELHALLGDTTTTHRTSRATPADVRDLQTLYLLTWCSFELRTRDPVKALIAKGKRYSEDDKLSVFEAMVQAMRETLPLFADLQARGQVEVTTTPYYHPILPLVVDSRSAVASRQDVQIDGIEFNYPADAHWHVQAAVDAYRRHFGSPPAGMWPAEGSVSDGALRILDEHGIRWAGTDEGVLGKSLGKFGLSPAEKHRPYRFADTELWVYFRDRDLSDRIGFVYSGWNSLEAAEDVISRLLSSRRALGDRVERHCFTIILDGENPWEYYHDGGEGFLNHFYRLLAETPGLEAVRFRDHREAPQDEGTLQHIVPGSWIDANFDTWIGCPEKNHAWKILAASRRELAEKAPEAPVPREIYRAEGSDWFWWLGPGHETPYESSYENLFRLNLRLGLERAGVEPPSILDEATPIVATPVFEPPLHLSRPHIDGQAGTYYDWLGAGFYRASEGSFHRTVRFLDRIRFTFDLENLYLRLEGNLEPLGHRDGEGAATLVLEFGRPRGLALEYGQGTLRHLGGEVGASGAPGDGALGRVLEMRIPFETLGASTGDLIEFAVELRGGGNILDRLPQSGSITIARPGPDYGQENWSV